MDINVLRSWFERFAVVNVHKKHLSNNTQERDDFEGITEFFFFFLSLEKVEKIKGKTSFTIYNMFIIITCIDNNAQLIFCCYCWMSH